MSIPDGLREPITSCFSIVRQRSFLPKWSMPSSHHASPVRVNSGWLAGPERRALEWIAPRVPTWVSPDQLTALGLLGAAVAAAGYVLSTRAPAWLWLVNAGLVVNWFGDSLDGNVARLRGIGRPRYGFFLDQSVDVFAQLLFAVGLGLSGYVSLSVAMAGLATYLMMTVQSLLRAAVTGDFHLATGGFGLTEVRCLFLAGNVVFFLIPPIPLRIDSLTIVYGDILGVVWIMANTGLYLAAMTAELRRLNRSDPPPPRKS